MLSSSLSLEFCGARIEVIIEDVLQKGFCEVSVPRLAELPVQYLSVHDEVNVSSYVFHNHYCISCCIALIFKSLIIVTYDIYSNVVADTSRAPLEDVVFRRQGSTSYIRWQPRRLLERWSSD